jgi:sugar O-acyltransferase (sialic acid O-acetyltransferase NeuD family)
MRLENLSILGLSEPTLSMIFDNLESCQFFPNIQIINNLKIKDFKAYQNKLFNINVVDDFANCMDCKHLFLGVNKPLAKAAVYAACIDDININKSQFINIIHQSTAISSTTTLGFGVHINSLVSIAAFSKIGNFVSINRNASVGHHTVIDNFVTINPGAHIAGFVHIGERTLIGMGAAVLDGVRIGKNTIIGAGAVVTKDMPDNVVAYGNPCVVIRKNET